MSVPSSIEFGANIELWPPQTDDRAATSAGAPEAEPIHGRGTPLLVDDKKAVRLGATEMLADLGYGVIEAASAKLTPLTVDRFAILQPAHVPARGSRK